MRKTIKQLEEELLRIKDDRNRYYTKYLELKEAEEKKRQNDMMNLRFEKEETQDQNKKLMEIIRWLVNSETTKFPFAADKEQRDERKPFNY